MGDGVGDNGFPIILLDKPIQERRKYFSDYIIIHPFLKQAVSDTVSKIEGVKSRKIVFVCGPPGVGKNELVNKVSERLIEQAQPKLLNNKGCIAVVNVEASVPDSGKFNLTELWTSALKIMKEPMLHKKVKYIDEVILNSEGEPVILSKVKKGNMQEVLENALKFRQSSALVVNDAHHFLRVSDDKDANWEVIKSLANNSRTPIVLVGTYQLSQYLENLDKYHTDQVSIIEFPRYSNQVKSQAKTFENITIQLLRHMPLEKAAESLVNYDFVYFYKYTLGCVGILKDWLDSAYDLALQDHAVTLTMKHLEETRISGHRCAGMLRSITDGEVKMARIGQYFSFDRSDY